MERNAAVALLGGLAIAAGLLLGFTAVGDDCGSALAPDYSASQMQDGLGPFGGHETDCRDAVSSRRPIAYGALGFGALAVLMSFAIPSVGRPESVD